MNIKYVLGIVIVILLISNIICVYEMQNSNQNLNGVGVIGDKSIKLPENFSLENGPNQIELSNGVDKIYVYKLNTSDIDSAINEYKNKFSENFTITVKEFDSKFADKKTIAIKNDTAISKYWFKLDDSVYQIQMNKNDKEHDEIVKNMINSMSK